MNLKQIEYFVRIAELGSITKAATLLSVAQPSLSKQVRQLETELRQHLLIRNGRGVSLTEEGAVFLKHAKGVLDQLDRARHEINDIKGSPIGKVVVGAPSTAGKGLIARLVAEYKQRFPKATLEIIEAKSWSIYEWLLSGRIDIGLLYDPRPSPLIETIPVIQEEAFLISSPSSVSLPKSAVVALKQLEKFPLILPSYPHTMRILLETAAARAGIKLDVVLQVEGASFILELVDQGFGCTVLARHILEESNLIKRLQSNAIVRPRLSRTLAIAMSSQRPVTHLARETAGMIRSYLEAA